MQIYGIKESIYIRKEFNSCRTVLGYQYGHRDVTWKRPKECFHRTSCPPYSVVSHDNETVGGILVLQILSFLLFLENLHSCWARVWKGSIEYFHSCGQHLCKFIGTKGSVCIRKEFNSQRIDLGHQHGRRFIVLGHQYGVVTSCENTLLNNAAVTEASLKLTPRIGRSSAFPFKRRQHR